MNYSQPGKWNQTLGWFLFIPQLTKSCSSQSLLQVHLGQSESGDSSSFPPELASVGLPANICFLLPGWLMEDCIGCLFATPMLCHHCIMPDLRGFMVSSHQPKFIIYVLVGSFIASAGSLPLLPDSPLPPSLSLLRCVCVHHDFQASPSSDEEAQSDGSDKPPEEPEDPWSWRRGWRRRSAPLKGQITSCHGLFISTFFFFPPFFQDAFAHQTA